MIVNRTHRFIFVHVPKTGGTSLTAWLSSYTNLGDVEIGGTEFGESVQTAFHRRFGLDKHATAAEIGRKLGNEFEQFFSFAIVRDPYSRARSLYNFIRSWDGPHRETVQPMTFEEFLSSDLVSKGRYNICRPQAHWLFDNHDNCLVDFIGRLEDIDDALEAIASDIGEPEMLPELRKLNTSPDLQKAVSPEAAALIEHIYERDFRLLNYALIRSEQATEAVRHLARNEAGRTSA